MITDKVCEYMYLCQHWGQTLINNINSHDSAGLKNCKKIKKNLFDCQLTKAQQVKSRKWH